jgi:hypothetical protein
MFAFPQSHVDSLYKRGVISLTEYNDLIRPAPHVVVDTLTEKLNYYDSLFRVNAITEKEHWSLVDAAQIRYDHSSVFNPKVARQTAKRQTTGGVITMLLADVLGSIAIGRAASNGTYATDGANIVAITFSFAFRGIGVGLFAHTATLRRRAERHEAKVSLQ